MMIRIKIYSLAVKDSQDFLREKKLKHVNIYLKI